MPYFFIVYLLLCCLATPFVANANLSDAIAQIKPSVVGVGVYTPLGRPQNKLFASGFVIGSGNYVVTNFHVLPKELDQQLKQKMVVFVGSGRNPELRKATVVATEPRHDLALLKIEGKPLPPLKLADDKLIAEGTDIAFTGFPIGSVLGLYPATHKGIIAAITPTVIPVDNASQISLQVLKRLRNPYLVYQLDATAYPGNSGSALYNPKTREVVGIINKVFVQGTKEAALTNPSGITYAIPVKYLRELLRDTGIKL